MSGRASRYTADAVIDARLTDLHTYIRLGAYYPIACFWPETLAKDGPDATKRCANYCLSRS